MPTAGVTSGAALATARSALEAATHRDAVIDALVDYLASLYRRAAFFAVRQDRLQGWRSAGTGREDGDDFRRVQLPLTGLTAVVDAVTMRLPRLGPADEATAAAMAAPMGGPLGDVLIVPLALGERAVGVALADGPLQPFSPTDLVVLTHAAARALERVISTRKSDKR
jgi:hypothetical protein